MKLTPVLVVEEIEKSLPFWIDRMGWTKAVEVPDGERLGFVILVNGGAELMLQTVGSVQRDEPRFAPHTEPRVSSLFIEVDDFADARSRLSDYPIAMAERVAFYGMREIGVFEPSGNIVVFAARKS